MFDFCIFPLAKTVNSSILQYDLESLTRKTSYTVQVMASTSAGGINGTGINFKTLSISEYSFSPWEYLLGISFRPVTDGVCQGQEEAKWKGDVRRTICSLTHWPSRKAYEWWEGELNLERWFVLLLPQGWPQIFIERRDQVNANFTDTSNQPHLKTVPSSQSIPVCQTRKNLALLTHLMSHLWSLLSKKVHNMF